MHTQKILVIDDHPLVARGIADFIQTTFGFKQALSASCTDEFWCLLENESNIALAIIDFWLPDGAALTLISQCKSAYPYLPLLVMSADDNPAVQKKVQLTGANGFVLKHESPEKFAEAVKLLCQGQSRFTITHSGIAKFHQQALPISAKELGLTERQGQVLALVLEGYPNKRIAQMLKLSETTVKEHITGILEKLGVANRIGIITKLRGQKLSL